MGSRWQFNNCKFKFKFECNWQGLQFLYFLGFIVLAVVTVKSNVIWDVMQCSPMGVHWHFRRICCLHIQGLRIAVLAACLLGLPFNPEDPLLWRQCIPLKCWISTDYAASRPGSLDVFKFLVNMSNLCQIFTGFCFERESKREHWCIEFCWNVNLNNDNVN